MTPSIVGWFDNAFTTKNLYVIGGKYQSKQVDFWVYFVVCFSSKFAKNVGYVVVFWLKRFAEIVLDKWLDVAVHHFHNVGVFKSGAVVLDKGVWAEHVGSNLATPLDLFDFALDGKRLFHLLAFL